MRATQTLISHMGYCRKHPLLWAIEIGWRWLAGVPFLWVAWHEAQLIVAQIPLASVGWNRLEWGNPWLSSVLLADAIGRYQPLVVGVLRWLAPVAVLGWAILSGIGRMAILDRMVRIDGERARYGSLWRKLPGVIVLQAMWMAALLGCWLAWYVSVGWAASRYITVGAQPNMVAYLSWLIFLSLGIYVVWAMTSWVLSVAPVVYVMESRSLPGALSASFQLGKELSGKLAEVNLVMAIVKIALIVLAMVFSSAPLPFSQEFGSDFIQKLYWAIAVGYLVGSDYFHVVRLRSFVNLRRHYRGHSGGSADAI